MRHCMSKPAVCKCENTFELSEEQWTVVVECLTSKQKEKLPWRAAPLTLQSTLYCLISSLVVSSQDTHTQKNVYI